MVDARRLTGSVDPVADPYVFKSQVNIPPAALAAIGPVTMSPDAVLELRRTVNFNTANGTPLLEAALAPAGGYATIRNGNAPIVVAQFSYAAAPTVPFSGWMDVDEVTLMSSVCESGELTTSLRWPDQTFVLDPTKSLIIETVIRLSQDPGALLEGATYPVRLPVGWWVDLGLNFDEVLAGLAYQTTEQKCLYEGGVDDGSSCWTGSGSEAWSDSDWDGLDNDGSTDVEADLLTQAEDCEARLVLCRQHFEHPGVGVTGAWVGDWHYTTRGFSFTSDPDPLLGDLAGQPFLHKTVRTIPQEVLRTGGSSLLEVALGLQASGAFEDPYLTTGSVELDDTLYQRLKGAVVIEQHDTVLKSLGAPNM